MVIHKYKLFDQIHRLYVPRGSKILSVKEQNNEAVVYILQYDSKTNHQITMRSYETGEPIPQHPGKFVGTVMLDGGGQALHIFQEGVV